MLDVVRRLRDQTDSVLVGVSRGKDSLVCLDLAKQHFARVEAFCMYLVSELSFFESYLGYLERRYAITIDRVPHWWLSQAFRKGSFRPLTRTCPRVTIGDIHRGQRERTGLEWVVEGQKACDSLQRRGMLSACNGIDPKRMAAYPLAKWSNAAVYDHLRRINLPLPSDYRLIGSSISCGLDGPTLVAIQEHYPDDFQKILQVFPFAEAAVCRLRAGRDPAVLRAERGRANRRAAAQRRRKRTEAAPAAEVRGEASPPGPAEPGPLQPADPGQTQPEAAPGVDRG